MMLPKIRIAFTTLALGLLTWSQVSRAYTTSKVEYTCPYDGTRFTAVLAMSGSQFTVTLDLKPVGMTESPWPMAECPTNGFVFYQDKFSNEELEKLRPLILSSEYQALKKETTYYRAAWIMERTGTKHSQVTWTLLRALWQNHAYAPKLLERLPQDISEVEGEEKLNLRMLQAELLRQVGRWDEAKAAFAVLQSEVHRFSTLDLVIRYELRLIEQHDTGTKHTVEDAVTAMKDDPEIKAAHTDPVMTNGKNFKKIYTFDSVKLAKEGNNFRWLSDSKQIIASSDTGAILIDTDTKAVKETTVETFYKTIALVAGNQAYITDGEKLIRLDLTTLTPSQADMANPDGIVMSNDGTAILYRNRHALEVRDLATNQPRSLGEPFPVAESERNKPIYNSSAPWRIFSLDPTGPRILIKQSSASEFVIWDYERREKVAAFQSKDKFSTQTAYWANGKGIYIVDDIGSDGELAIWDMTSKQFTKKVPASCRKTGLAVSSDGRYVALLCDKQVRVYDAHLNDVVETFTLTAENVKIPAISFSPDSKKFAIHTNEAIQVYAISE
jgi:hypothetical protein